MVHDCNRRHKRNDSNPRDGKRHIPVQSKGIYILGTSDRLFFTINYRNQSSVRSRGEKNSPLLLLFLPAYGGSNPYSLARYFSWLRFAMP